MDEKIEPVQRVMKLEQQRGMAFAMTLVQSLIKTMEEEVEFRKNEQPDQED
jgi:hypothetical protein